MEEDLQLCAKRLKNWLSDLENRPAGDESRLLLRWRKAASRHHGLVVHPRDTRACFTGVLHQPGWERAHIMVRGGEQDPHSISRLLRGLERTLLECQKGLIWEVLAQPGVEEMPGFRVVHPAWEHHLPH